MLVRLPDWAQRLRAFTAATHLEPFAWSTHDCATWTLRAVDAMCGTSLAAPFAGAYCDAAGALAFCQSHGWRTLGDAVESFGGVPLPVLQSQAGDVGFFPPGRNDPNHPPVGVLLVNIGSGPNFCAVLPDQGWRLWPLRAFARAGGRAFAIGRTP